MTTSNPDIQSQPDDTEKLENSAPTEDGAGHASEGRSVPLATVAFFLLGCAIMVFAAANIMNLPEWADRWGQLWVFLAFFVVMATGGRWFFGGIDAFIAAARGKGGSA